MPCICSLYNLKALLLKLSTYTKTNFMNRNSFLKSFLAVGSFLSTPFAVMAKPFSKKRVDKCIKVDAGKDRFGKPISLFEGDTFYTKVSTTDTNGDVYVFESTRVKEGGPSFHLHYEQDEFWYILKGEFLFKVGDETFTAKAGDTVFGPRNVPHAFAKVGEGEAKLLMFFQPAGKMEEMFKKIGEGATKNITTDEGKDKFFHEHGLKRVGPPLTYSKW
jgi:mannose-6-phosphate isomerase-like protein (cupin superfamily)